MHDLVSGVKAVSQGAESIGQGEWYRKHGMGSHLFPGEDDLSMAPEDTSAGVHVFWSASCAALAQLLRMSWFRGWPSECSRLKLASYYGVVLLGTFDSL